MNSLSSLGTFLTLSYLMPGIVILSGLVILFPDVRVLVEHMPTAELFAAVFVVSFLHGHPCLFIELHFMDHIWSALHPSLNLSNRKTVIFSRSSIISSAEVHNITHAHFDAVMGEFILFTNSSMWLILASTVRIFMDDSIGKLSVSLLIGFLSILVLLFTSPFFKGQYLSALEVLQGRVAACEAREEEGTSSATVRKEDEEKIIREISKDFENLNGDHNGKYFPSGDKPGY